MKFNDLTQQQKDIIMKHFCFSTNPPYRDIFSDFLDVIADIFGELSKEEIDSIMVHGPGHIREVVCNSMLSLTTRRIVAEHYFGSPFDVDWDLVYNWLIEDLCIICITIRESEYKE